MTDVRYGIFLRPDAATCWTVTQITFALKQQFGLVSAGAFPPHATIIGNFRTEASQDELIAVLDDVFAGVQPLTVYNSGIERNSDRYGFNLNLNESATDVNRSLEKVARRVSDAVEPLCAPPDPPDLLTPGPADYSFAAHLSLAAHELAIDNRLSDEIGEFLEGLPITPPASFTARWYSLFEFRADWSSYWWEHMTWRHLRSWDVSASRDTGSHGD